MPLVFVPTPLGNLRDITLRALERCGACDVLVAEDSRVARKLLSALELPGKEIWTYQEHNMRAVTPGILERRKATRCRRNRCGNARHLGSRCRAGGRARERRIAIEVLPGASAATGAAVLSGFDLRRFIFEGFLPRTSPARARAR